MIVMHLGPGWGRETCALATGHRACNARQLFTDGKRVYGIIHQRHLTLFLGTSAIQAILRWRTIIHATTEKMGLPLRRVLDMGCSGC